MSQSSGKRTPEAMAFAAQLRSERAASRMTQSDLAKRSGLSLVTINRLEAGTRTLDTDQLGAICRALGISIATFAMRAEERLQAERAAEAEERLQAERAARAAEARQVSGE